MRALASSLFTALKVSSLTVSVEREGKERKKVKSTMVDNSQEYRLEYWATRSSVRLFAHTAHSFARLLTSFTPSLVGQ